MDHETRTLLHAVAEGLITDEERCRDIVMRGLAETGARARRLALQLANPSLGTIKPVIEVRDFGE
jgi:hypothetical protein